MQIVLSSRRGTDQRPLHSSAGRFWRIKAVLAALLIASATIGFLLAALVLGSIIAAAVLIIVVLGLAIAIVRTTLRRAPAIHRFRKDPSRPTRR